MQRPHAQGYGPPLHQRDGSRCPQSKRVHPQGRREHSLPGFKHQR